MTPVGPHRFHCTGYPQSPYDIQRAELRTIHCNCQPARQQKTTLMNHDYLLKTKRLYTAFRSAELTFVFSEQVLLGMQPVTASISNDLHRRPVEGKLGLEPYFEQWLGSTITSMTSLQPFIEDDEQLHLEAGIKDMTHCALCSSCH